MEVGDIGNGIEGTSSREAERIIKRNCECTNDPLTLPILLPSPHDLNHGVLETLASVLNITNFNG